MDAYNDPNINADLQTFDAQYGLATCSEANGCLRVVNQTGNATPLPANDSSGWSVEESLDVETVHSVCQSCRIILVEANSNGNGDLGTAENTAVGLGANEVSNSSGNPRQARPPPTRRTSTTQGPLSPHRPGTTATTTSTTSTRSASRAFPPLTAPP